MPRRGFLGALALAPAAIGGCKSATAAGSATAAAPSPAAGRPPPQPARGTRTLGQGGGGAEAVRAFPLPPGTEPAFVFRAAVRSGEP